MFTGLIEGVGAVVEARKVGGEMDLSLDLGSLVEGAAVGASIALSGVCCTVTAVLGTVARFWLSEETLRRTWFATLTAGHKLNIERCLRLGQEMGGHIVQGHVDGVGRVREAVGPMGGTFAVEVPESLARYCVEKGSIALDGVSLTIATLVDNRMTAAIIPHTAALTTLGSTTRDAPINVEVDVLAKYVERLLAGRLR